MIGARQHGLGVLMHDAAHYRLFRSRFWNDTLSDLLLAFPLGFSTRAYRKTHIAHHRFLNTDDDPDLMVTQQLPAWWSWPMRAPHGIHYRLSHHLFPSVPSHHLAALHQRLMQEPLFRQEAHLTTDYLNLRGGLLSEVVRNDAA